LGIASRPDVAYVSDPDRSGGFAVPDAASKVAVVVSDVARNTVDAYDPNGKLVATITGFRQPQGLATDSAGNIYVVNTNAHDVLVYKNDYKTRILSLENTGQLAIGVGVDFATGLVGVANAGTTANGLGSVEFYARGMTAPCVTVKNNRWQRVYFGAFDDSGNFYVDGFDKDARVLVGVVKGGCKATTITTLTTANTLFFPGGVQVSPAGAVAVLDQQARAVYAYKPALTGSLGAPLSSTTLSGAVDPVSFAFTSDGEALWEADAASISAEPRAIEFAFPAGNEGPHYPLAGFDEPLGIVVTPPVSP